MDRFQLKSMRQPDTVVLEALPPVLFRRMTGMAVLALTISLFLFPCTGRAAAASVNDSVATQPANPPQPSNQGQLSAPSANGAADEDQSGVRVARLSDVEGTVQILRGDQVEFSKAIENMPVPQGSRIETGADGRAEIEFEDGSVARLTPSSSLGIETLGSAANGNPDTVLKQHSGLVYYELRSDDKAPYTVLLDQGAVHPKVNSTFRVDLTTAPAALAVIDGDVQVLSLASKDPQAEAHQGQMIQFHPSATVRYTVLDGIIPNGFDDWNNQRDEEAAKQAANQTSARAQMGNGMDSGIAYGWSDLDTYGGWYPLPGYGMVWQPYGVGADFDPYGFGSWADIDGFGISWISGYPWGWLPFHCGGWSYINTFGWGWLPGGCGFGGGIGYGYGFGFGYGGYGRFRSIHHRRPYVRIYRGPSGYREPAPPTHWRAGTGIRSGRPERNLVSVGRDAFAGHRVERNRVKDARTVHFNGRKIAPLHSGISTTSGPTRNAALYNNRPAHAFPGGMRSGLQHPTRGLRESSVATRGNGFDARRGGRSNRQSFGATNREAFVHGNRFGQHTVFGSHGSFGGPQSSFQNGSAFRGMGRRSGFRGGGINSDSGFHGGAFRNGNIGSRGGFHGGGFQGGAVRAGGANGFHGGGFRGGASPAGGGFHGGGMSAGGGGFHGGGGSHGGGGGHGR